MSQKSLFSYFKSSPKDNKTNAALNGSTSKSPVAEGLTSGYKQAKRGSDAGSAKENTKPKRRRVIISDDSDSDGDKANNTAGGESSGEEYKPNKSQLMEFDSDSDFEADSKSAKSPANSVTKLKVPSIPTQCSTPKQIGGASKALSPNGNSSCATPNQSTSIGQKTLSKLSSFSAPPETPDSAGPKFHQLQEFLKPDKIRDKERRLRTDPDYDCRTLYIPDSFKQSVTPAMRQWWILKEDHFDTILFFKVGKFYEFFHMDADVGVKELGLVYMKGAYAHAGFPEIGYSRYADTLLRKGYKIARIEQTETPDMMNERVATQSSNHVKVTKFDKVVKREVCQITTPGTRTPNFLDGETIDVSSNYLMAVCEKAGDKGSHIGVCFLDTSIGKIYMGQFTDDRYGSRLRTLVAHYTPGQILHEKRSQSPLLSHLFKTTLSSVMKEALVCGKEFLDAERTIQVLSEAEYFKKGDDGQLLWPGSLKTMLSDGDAVFRKPKESYELAVKCLGAMVWYLRFAYLDDEILSLASFTEYIPLDSLNSSATDVETTLKFESSRMVLDSVTLANLDILENQTTGTQEGSLIERLDKCRTAGGKRLLREWLSAPLCDHRLINDRQEAVSNLMAMGDLSPVQTNIMKKLPDFERLLSRIHTLGHAKRAQTHPDSRAIMFDSDVYSKRKIESFLSVITGFKSALEVVPFFKDITITSNLLKKCVTFKEDGGHLADVRHLLKYFEDAFDHDAARKAGAIHPAPGYVEEYDEFVKQIKDLNSQLDDYLRSQRKLLCSQEVSYVGTGRNRYQLEVPNTASKRVPSSYEASSQKKNYKRYVTDETKSLLSKMMEAEAKQDLALKDTMRRIFNKFDESYQQWMDVVQCMNVLDVLLSLASYAMTSEGVMCRPEVIPPSTSQQPLIEIRDGRHPSAIKTFAGSDFIPNDTVIGCSNEAEEDSERSKAELLLLTGPNMGGKSTLMRQVGLLTVMSQLGCYVPAEKCRLTPVDRMFTRLGASDRIMHGESTFFVELSETSIILQHATRHSLVLLDELGRGTATHDGTAIASAVVKELAEYTKCRTIFSTHYHSLVDDFIDNKHVQLGHMACMVNEDSSDVENTSHSDADSSITFLYKLAASFCPKSYGFNVARLAGLPRQVIEMGLRKSQELEKITESRRLIRSVMSAEDMQKITLLTGA